MDCRGPGYLDMILFNFSIWAIREQLCDDQYGSSCVMTKSSQLLGGAVGRLHYHAARFAGDVCRPKSGEVKTHIAKQGQK